jgi:hypothetical protein
VARAAPTQRADGILSTSPEQNVACFAACRADRRKVLSARPGFCPAGAADLLSRGSFRPRGPRPLGHARVAGPATAAEGWRVGSAQAAEDGVIGAATALRPRAGET